MSIFDIKKIKYKDKIRNLDKSSSGIVYSTKFFPVFQEEGEEYIFKPLSKTKPLLTPLFSYSEVYWSYLLKKYIDYKTPSYHLAICSGIEDDTKKYYEKGTLVKNILQEEEELINLLEIYQKYPDSSVDISKYINYCERQYDYSKILNSSFFTERKDLGKQLSEQILCSILRRDDNYHYENVSFIQKRNDIERIAPMIDFEFSEMFLFPDLEGLHKEKFSLYDEGMSPIFYYNNQVSFEENYDIFIHKIEDGSVYDYFDKAQSGNLLKNLKTIVELYPEVVENFLNKLSKMKEELSYLEIELSSDFLGEFSSYDWEASRMLLKGEVTEEDKRYKEAKNNAEENKIVLDMTKFKKQLKKEVLWSIKKLERTLKLLLEIQKGKVPNIIEYKNETLYEPVKRYPEELLEHVLQDTVKKKNKKIYKI